MDEFIKREINLFFNTDYIDWLTRFTDDNGDFSDTDWLYSSEKLDEYTQDKVDSLHLFFEGIYQYAKKNYIYSEDRPLGEYFHLMNGDVGFEIGYISGQGTSFYCKRISIEEMDSPIDFMDIINNKKQDNVDFIENNLKRLSDLFIELYNNGVHLDAMIEIINRSISSIDKQEREKQKVFTKTNGEKKWI